ncbi:MAG: hypothetical protein QNJ09_18315 [Paracoccaceae bacterium]|nr:hypothetical protein [Paracoccaceae bacterium]
MTVTVHPSVYHGDNQAGDFAWMITQPAYAKAFFIFNDNQGEFLAFQGNTSATSGQGCMVGGGNAVIRPYQCMSPPRAGGIPTGSFAINDKVTRHGYPDLTPEVQSYIDTAVAFIAQRIAANGYTDVYYSSDGHGGLGHGIFNPADDVRAYIVQKIEGLAQA